MRYLKIISTLSFILFLGVQTALAQQQMQQPQAATPDDVSDEELAQFAQTLNELEPLQLELQSDIENLVNSENMEMERFQEIMIAMQNPQMADQADISDEEQEKIGKMQPKLVELQMGAQQKMVSVIEDNGLEIQRYRELMLGVQQHQELATRLQSKLENSDSDQ